MVFINYTKKGKYVFPEKEKFICKENFKLAGNNTISFMKNGKWSKPPQCSFKVNFLSTSNNSEVEFFADSRGESKSRVNFLVVVLLLIILLMIMVIAVVRYKIKLKRARKLGLKGQEILPGSGRVWLFQGNFTFEKEKTFDAIIFYHFDTDDDFVLSHLLPESEERF